MSGPLRAPGARLSSPAKGANPLIALLPNPSRVDYAYWKAVLRSRKGACRAEGATRRGPPAGLSRLRRCSSTSRNPISSPVATTRAATAEFIPQYGSAAGKRPVARILGTLAAGHAAGTVPRVPEDNGSIPRAGAIRMTVGSRRASTTGTIGDGPHGSNGDGSWRLRLLQVGGRESRPELRGRHRYRRSGHPRLRGCGVGRGRQPARAQRRRRCEPRQPVALHDPARTATTTSRSGASRPQFRTTRSLPAAGRVPAAKARTR